MSAKQFPTSPEQMTASWLESTLGVAIGSADVEPIGAGSGFAGSVYRVHIEYADANAGFAKTLIWKTVSNDERTRGFLTMLGAYERESRFYELLADGVEIAPRLFFSEFDPESGAFCLITEDLSYMKQANQIEGCTFEQALEVATGAAKLHSQFWSERVDDRLAWVPTFDGGSGYFERMHSTAWTEIGINYGRDTRRADRSIPADSSPRVGCQSAPIAFTRDLSSRRSTRGQSVFQSINGCRRYQAHRLAGDSQR